MTNLTRYIRDELLSHGADLVGVGSLSELPSDIRCGLPVGICVAAKYPKEVIRVLPTCRQRNITINITG